MVKKPLKKNSFIQASFLSKIIFYWVNKTLSKTKSEPLDQKMHESLLPEINMFRTSQDSAKTFNKKISLPSLCFKDFQKKTLILTSILILCISEAIQIFIIYYVTEYLNSDEVQQNGINRSVLSLYFLAIILSQIVYSFFEIISKFECFLQLIKLRNNFIYRILERSLSVNFTTAKLTSKGNVINLIQIDCQYLIDEGYNAYNGIYGIVNSFVCIAIGVYLISYFFFVYVLSAFFWIFLVIFFLKKKMNVETKLLLERDKRINFLTSAISNIRYIKYNVYELFFSKIGHLFRIKELKLIKWLYIFFGIASFFNWMAPGINVVSTFYFLFSNDFVLSAGILMGLQRIVFIIENAFRLVPMMLQAVFKFSILFKRVRCFKSAGITPSIHSHVKLADNSDIAVKIKGEYFYEENEEQKEKKNDNKEKENDNQEKFNLKIENIEIKKGELVFIVGQLGCGKTSFIKSIFGELKSNEDSECFINGSFSYCCQDGFVQSKSLKENILFYDEYDADRFNNSIRLACLEGDLKDFEKGVEKMIGDAGTKISKGQKIRINLARCFYKDYDILFLDDPFSALDMNISKNILDKSILNELKNKTRIIVTHSLHYLQHADRIIYIGKGEILFNGIYQDFIKQDFKKEFNLTKEKKIKEEQTSRKNSKKLIEPENLKEEEKEIEIKNFYETDEKKGRKLKYSFKLLRKYFGGIFYLFLTVLSSFFQTFMGYYITIILYNFITDSENKDYKPVMIKITILLLVPGGLTFIKYYILLYYGVKTSKDVHTKMMNRIFHASPSSFFDKMDRSFIINRFSNDLIQIDDRYFINLIFFLDFLAFCIMDIVITCVSVTYFSILTYFIYYGFVFFLHNRYITIRKDVYRLDYKTRTPVIEIAKNILEGRIYFDIFKKQKKILKELKEKINENTKNVFLKVALNGWFDVRIAFYNILFVQVISFALVLFFFYDSFETANLVIFIAYVFVMVKRTKFLLYFLTELETMIVSLERCENFCELEPEENYFVYRNNEKEILKNIGNKIGSDLIKKQLFISNEKFSYEEINSKGFDKFIFKKGKVEIKNIWAKYDGQENYVLKNINLTLESGKKLGICGKTGSGKSSLIKLILRHFSYEKGDILIDGYDISKMDIKQLRSEFLIINQEIALFEGTLRENMNPEFIKFRSQKKTKKNKNTDDLQNPLLIKTEKEIIESEDQKIIDNLIKCGFEKKKLDNLGLNFKIESGGGNLSNGEKQLISLFKIFFTNKKIIILDEATSSMDVKSEKIILEIFDRLIEGKTLISIAHRVTSIVRCDNIVVLSKGEIVETGNPQELIKQDKSLFKKYLDEMKLD